MVKVYSLPLRYVHANSNKTFFTKRKIHTKCSIKKKDANRFAWQEYLLVSQVVYSLVMEIRQ